MQAEPGGALTVLGGALARVADEQGPGPSWRQVGDAWVRLPAAASPSIEWR